MNNSLLKIVEAIKNLSINIGGDDADYVMRAAAQTAQNFAAATWTKVNLSEKQYDPENNLSLANSRWTCGKNGYYQVNCQVYFQAMTGGILCGIYKNGVLHSISGKNYASGFASGVAVSDIIKMEKGDYIELWALQQDTVTRGLDITTGSPFKNYFSVGKINNPKTITNFETCGFIAVNSITTLAAAGVATDVAFVNKREDTHGAFNGTKFTVPAGKSGIYLFNALISANVTDSTKFICWIYINDVLYALLGRGAPGGTNIGGYGGGIHVRLNVGDTVKVVGQLFNASATQLTTNEGYNTFSGFLISK